MKSEKRIKNGILNIRVEQSTIDEFKKRNLNISEIVREDLNDCLNMIRFLEQRKKKAHASN